jgi:cytochrome P450
MPDPFYNPTVPEHVPASLVHDFNLFDYGGREPFSIFHRMHRDLPEMFWTRNNGGHWVVQGADAIAEMGPDTQRFSSARPYVPDSANFDDPVFYPLLVDPPLHTRYRRAVAPLLLPARIAALDASIREFTRSLAHEIKARGRCEFIADFATVMPVVVFLQYMDLPLSDRAHLVELAEHVVKPKDGDHRGNPVQGLFDYLAPFVDARMARPGNDIVSKIVTQNAEGGPLQWEEIMRLTVSILLGGLETTASVLGFMARYLAETPAARRQLVEHPALAPAAVEEMLRRFSPLMVGRTATADLNFRNVTMKKHDHAAWMLGMFNTDETRFPDAMTVDFRRPKNPHMTFGIGPHFCVGHFLARQELRVFLEEWLKIIPDFRVAPDANIAYRTGVTLGLTHLPLVMP